MPYIGTQPKDVRSFGKVQFDFTATQGQTAFTGADDDGKTLGFTEGQIQVYVNGILMDASDYTTSNTNTVTLVSAANLNDIITVVALQTDIPNSDYVPISGGTFTGDVNFSSDVAIGTSSPDVPLQVHSDALGGNAGDDQQLFRLHSPDASNNTTYRFLNYRYTAGSSHSSSELRIQRHVDVTNQGYIGFRDGATTFGYDTTERMRIDNVGRVTMPYQPAFNAYRTDGGQTTTAGSTFAFNVTGMNIGGHYSTSTYRFTAPVAGVYHFSAGVYRNSSGERWGFAKNGTHPRQQIGFVAQTVSERQNSVSLTDYLNAGDYVTVREWSGQSYLWWGSHSWFSGFLVG